MVTLKSALSLPLIGLLVACGGGTGGGATTGTFSLGVSDNPANVTGVTVAFKQVVLKGEQVFSFDVSDNGAPQQVDLMQFTGAAIEGLISGKQVPVGDYQLCIYVLNNTGADPSKSFVETSGTMEGLVTNSNGSCGGVGGVDEEGVDEENGTGRLFFNKPFTIAAGENNYVAEFNLEKGLLSPRGDKAYWTLKPTAVQIINNAEVGSISGQIGSTLRADCQADAGGEFGDRVYLYPNNSALVSSIDPEIKQMVDFRLAEQVVAMEVAPLAASAVEEVLDAEGNTVYEYEFGFVAAGSYSLGYSCLGQNDDQEVDNMPTGTATFSLFSEQSDVVVVPGQGAERDFFVDPT